MREKKPHRHQNHLFLIILILFLKKDAPLSEDELADLNASLINIQTHCSEYNKIKRKQ